jgi:beta-lactamase superfamily II metal-dependent hydrolase
MLLTGDAEKSVFSRIGKRKGGRLEGHKMGVAQIPHHGAKGNLNKIFWQKLKRFAKTYNIISVGENKYKHPSLDVLNFFEKTPNYIVYCTNDKGEGLSEKSKLNSLVLDIVSSDLTQVKNNRNIFGDLTFNLSGNTYKVL